MLLLFILIHGGFVCPLSPENIPTVSAIKNQACATAEKPVNGYFLPVYGPKEELVSVNYRCHPPFTLIGSQQRICQPNGTWSGTVPTCLKGTFSPGDFWSPFLVCVQHKSHILHLLEELVCFLSQTRTHTGQTSRVRCSPPPKLLNGYHRPAPGAAGGPETIEFFCKKSYILSGNHQSTCFSNGSWSSRPPKCVRGSCFQNHIRVGNTMLRKQVSYFSAVLLCEHGTKCLQHTVTVCWQPSVPGNLYILTCENRSNLTIRALLVSV